MNKLVWAGLLFLLIFIVLPPLVVLLRMSDHRARKDFDEDPRALEGTPYEPWRGEILEAIGALRQRPFENVSLSAADGVRLRARWYRGGPRTALLIHGYNATPLNNFAPLAETLLAEGWSVLMPDSRGHGGSGGRVTFGLKEAEDTRRWAAWACAREDCGGLLVYGMSMGGAAVNFASSGPWPEKVRALMVEAGYYSVVKQMETMPWKSVVLKWILIPGMMLFARPALGVSFQEDGLERLRAARLPMGFLTGTRDESVLPVTVEKAYEACGAKKRLWKTEGAPHTLAFLAGGKGLQRELMMWINQWMEQEEKRT